MTGPVEQFDELGLLTAALCDGEITPEEAVRLEDLVKASGAARQYFLQYVQLNGELYWEHAGSAGRGTLPELETLPSAHPAAAQWPLAAQATVPAARRPRPDPLAALLQSAARGAAWASRARPASLILTALAASLLLVGLALWAVPLSRLRTEGDRAAAARGSVARLTRTFQAEWSEGGAAKSEPAELVAGQELRLREGLAEITFPTGVRLILQGLCTFKVANTAQGFLQQGALTANVPPQAAGFTIGTPSATIVDLGTEFGVAVENTGASEVHVFAGSVEIRPDTPPGTVAAPRGVEAGQAVRVWQPAAGATPRIDEITSGSRSFVRTLPAAAPLAGSVAGLRALVARHPNLIHHYTFEGTTAEEKCCDKRGNLDLAEVVMCGGRGGGSLNYTAAGADATTNAIGPYRAAYGGNSSGVSLQSQATFEPPRELTVELLLNFAGGAQQHEPLISVAVATREDQRHCGLLIVAVDKGQLVHLLDGQAGWVEGDVEFIPGDWYYVASTFRAGSAATTVNSYVANLSRGEQKLNRVVRDQVAAGIPAASRLGIGKGFNDDIAHAYPWSGELDEVAIYDAVLDLKTLETHLKALAEGP